MSNSASKTELESDLADVVNEITKLKKWLNVFAPNAKESGAKSGPKTATDTKSSLGPAKRHTGQDIQNIINTCHPCSIKDQRRCRFCILSQVDRIRR